MSRTHRPFILIGAMAGAGALLLTACSNGPGVPSGGNTDDTAVTIYSSFIDAEATALRDSWAEWEKESGITINLEGDRNFETQISVRAQGGNAPDIAIFPQPGLMGDLAARDYLTEASAGVQKNLEQYWSEDWKEYASVDGTVYGAPLMASVKGFIWYSPSLFAENGWAVPETWEEMVTLTGQIREKTNQPPWCAGFSAAEATGWPGTDWIEDIVLRQSGPEVYDQWVNHEIPFTDPRIKDAFDAAGEILLDPANVNAGYGDVRSMLSVDYVEVADAVADGRCALHHQASFFDGFLMDKTNAAGEKLTVGEDGDIWAFITPPMAGKDAAVTGGGEIVSAFNDREATTKVLEYLSSPEWANSRVALGGVISANTGLDPAKASSPILQEAVKTLQDPATTFRFDGSDLMPSAVGAGSFWKGIIDWVNGTPVDEVLPAIDSAWPSE